MPRWFTTVFDVEPTCFGDPSFIISVIHRDASLFEKPRRASGVGHNTVVTVARASGIRLRPASLATINAERSLPDAWRKGATLRRSMH
jgi:hypothetical protein